MVHFSKQVDYALQLMIALAELKSGNFLSLRKFSQESNISFLFLQKIARDLREKKLINSTRGARGGYRLKPRAEEISLKQIIEAVDGPSGVTECLKKGGCCPKIESCTARRVFGHINKHFLNSIANYYLSQFTNYGKFSGKIKK